MEIRINPDHGIADTRVDLDIKQPPEGKGSYSADTISQITINGAKVVSEGAIATPEILRLTVIIPADAGMLAGRSYRFTVKLLDMEGNFDSGESPAFRFEEIPYEDRLIVDTIVPKSAQVQKDALMLFTVSGDNLNKAQGGYAVNNAGRRTTPFVFTGTTPSIGQVRLNYNQLMMLKPVSGESTRVNLVFRGTGNQATSPPVTLTFGQDKS